MTKVLVKSQRGLAKRFFYIYIFLNLICAHCHAIMVDRKARSFIFKTPPLTNLGAIRNGIQEITGEDSIKVFQEINAFEYLVELTTDHQIQEIKKSTAIHLEDIT